MNKEERVLKTINREEIDYLPSQITFSDRTRLSKIGKLMGFPQANDFEDYLQNHIYFTYTTNNQPLFNRNDEKLMKEIEEMGFVRVDWEKGVVYDEWGVGIEMHSDGIFPVFHPDVAAVGQLPPYLVLQLLRGISRTAGIGEEQGIEIHHE